MARLVGPSGRVFAYEPGSEARALLEEGRDAHGFANLEVLGFALSDGAARASAFVRTVAGLS